jgi:hypothetical protein
MSLTNEWANGEDSIQNPKNCRRSSNEGDDTRTITQGAIECGREADETATLTPIQPT